MVDSNSEKSGGRKGENLVVEKLENPMFESDQIWRLKVRKPGG